MVAVGAILGVGVELGEVDLKGPFGAEERRDVGGELVLLGLPLVADCDGVSFGINVCMIGL